MALTLYAKDSSNGYFVQLGTNDAKLTDHSSSAHAQVGFAGNIVKVDPAAFAASHNTLRPQDHATMTGIQLSQSIFDITQGEFPGSFHSPGSEDLISMMMAVIVTMIMAAAAVTIFVMMLMVIVMMSMTATAVTFLMMVVLMMIVMSMTATAVAFLMMVMLMVVVMTVMTAAALTFLMMVMLMVVVMMSMTATAVTIFVMVMVMMSVTATTAVTFLMMVVLQFLNGLFHRCFSSHGLQQLSARQFAPGGRYQRCLLIVLTQQCYRSIQLRLRDHVGTGQDDRGGGFDLIVIELTKVLHINLDLACIRYCNGIAQLHILAGYLFHRCHHIRQLTDTGGLNNDPIGMILLDHLVQCLAKVTHQRAADAAGVHFGDFNAGILQKTAVNADLTKFIFDENQLLTAVSFLDHFLDQRCLAGSKKTGINIDFSHK